MKSLLVILVLLLLPGCLASNMESWEGAHQDKLIQVWDPPTQETPLKNDGDQYL